MSGWRKYTVKAGHHYSNGVAWPFFGDELVFTVRFHESFMYKTDVVNAFDYSKAYGFREGIWYDKTKKKLSDRFVDRYSARVAGRPNLLLGKVDMAPYTHTYDEVKKEIVVIGAMNPPVLYRADIDEEVLCRIKIDGDEYMYTIGGNVDLQRRGNGHWLRFLSHLYVGGDFTVDHDVSVSIKRIA